MGAPNPLKFVWNGAASGWLHFSWQHAIQMGKDPQLLVG
jgi:hypothetical protein